MRISFSDRPDAMQVRLALAFAEGDFALTLVHRELDPRNFGRVSFSSRRQ